MLQQDDFYPTSSYLIFLSWKLAFSVPPNLAGPPSCFEGPAVVPVAIGLASIRGAQTIAELASRPFVIQLDLLITNQS